MKPGKQAQVPPGVQVPPEAQGVTHVADCIEFSVSWFERDDDEGSCERSGAVSHKISRVELEKETEAQVFGERRSDPAVICVCTVTLLVFGEGSATKLGEPEKFAWVYAAIPGCKSRSRGRVTAPLLNPGEPDREAEEAVRREWRSWGFVVEVYCPGRIRTDAGVLGAESCAPRERLVKPCTHWPAMHMTDAGVDAATWNERCMEEKNQQGSPAAIPTAEKSASAPITLFMSNGFPLKLRSYRLDSVEDVQVVEESRLIVHH